MLNEVFERLIHLPQLLQEAIERLIHVPHS
jgi:hypothetical protein